MFERYKKKRRIKKAIKYFQKAVSDSECHILYTINKEVIGTQKNFIRKYKKKIKELNILITEEK